jgi:hypothetical protein
MPDAGVNFSYPSDYSKILAYGTKSVEGANDIWRIKSIAASYVGRSYWPKNVSKGTSGIQFFKKWADINDGDSMYCSKFVYHVFKSYGNIDLNSHRTKVWLWELKDRYGNFVGITPDDIWASDRTSRYWDLAQPNSLWELIL